MPVMDHLGRGVSVHNIPLLARTPPFFQGLGVAQGRARIEERQTDRQERERCGVLPGLRPCASGLCVRADTPPRFFWKVKSQATRLVYSGLGYRFHLTGYQYWMKYHLTNLPDILALFHNDFISGGVVKDLSRYGNDGAVVGAIIADGLIDKSLWFDGIADGVDLGTPEHLKLKNDFTLEMFARFDPSQDTFYNPFGLHHSATTGYV